MVGYGDVDRDGFNTVLTYEAYKTDGYTTGELASHYPDWHRQTPGNSTWDARSPYSPTGNYFLSSTNVVAAPGCPAADIDPADKQCKYNLLDDTGATTDSKRWALASNTHFRIGKNIDANLDITAAGATTDYLLPGFTTQSTTSSSIWYNMIDKQSVGPFFYPKLPVGHASNPYAVPVEYRALLADTGDGFNFNQTKSKQYRVMLALSGEVYPAIGAMLINDSLQLRDAVGERLRHVPVSGESNLWLKALGAWGKADSRSETAGSTTSIGGLLAGVDGALDEQTRVGVANGSSASGCR